MSGRDHYFAEAPASGHRPRAVTVDLDGERLRFDTDGGVFSAGALDAGTRVLLDLVPPPPPGANLAVDLGCGWGAVAVALARRSDAAVWAVDVNRRARELTSRNGGTPCAGAHHHHRPRVPSGCGPTRHRPDLVESADPHRQGSATSSVVPVAGPSGSAGAGDAGGQSTPGGRFVAPMAGRPGIRREPHRFAPRLPSLGGRRPTPRPVVPLRIGVRRPEGVSVPEAVAPRKAPRPSEPPWAPG